MFSWPRLSVSEAGIACRVSPQGADDIGVVPPPQARPQPALQAGVLSLFGVEFPQLGHPVQVCGAVLGRVQRSRRNVVAGVGVRLVELPDAPSWGAEHIRIPSGRGCGGTGHSCGSTRHCVSTGRSSSARHRRVAFVDIHPSGDVESLHAPSPSPGPSSGSPWFACAAVRRMPIDAEMAKFITSSLIVQVGGDSGVLGG